MSDDVIALFEFVVSGGGIAILHEKHYRLVPADQIDPEEIKGYQSRSE